VSCKLLLTLALKVKGQGRTNSFYWSYKRQ